MNFKFILLAVAAATVFNSCKKDDKVVSDTAVGNVSFKFANYVGENPLELNSSGYQYANENGDSFNVTNYKYYVSNIRFVKSDGTEYLCPESYFLIDQADATTYNKLVEKIPAGTYTAMKVLLGVDSTRNVSGAQTGDLDPMHGMFWTWASGYIMAKTEGSFKGSGGTNTGYSFHLGGFYKFSVLRDIAFVLPQSLVISDKSSATINMKSDVLKWFAAPNLIKFQELNQVGAIGEDAENIADNYKSSMTVTSVEN